jgi:RecG-like helicase
MKLRWISVPPLTYVKGVGPGRASMLEAKGLLTVEDLLMYLPFGMKIAAT